MKTTKNFDECPCGEVEFKITWVTDGTYPLQYCPFCSVLLDEEATKEPEDDDNDDD